MKHTEIESQLLPTIAYSLAIPTPRLPNITRDQQEPFPAPFSGTLWAQTNTRKMGGTFRLSVRAGRKARVPTQVAPLGQMGCALAQPTALPRAITVWAVGPGTRDARGYQGTKKPRENLGWEGC